jgi:G:T/U mismatch-specific DNA glycosylase
MSDIETHPLPPFLPPNAKLLMLGSFPPPATRWKMNFYYPNYQNDMWRIFGLIFFKNKDYFLDLPNKKFQEHLIREFLTETGIAIFDSAYQIRRLKGNASDKFLGNCSANQFAGSIRENAGLQPHHDYRRQGHRYFDALYA